MGYCALADITADFANMVFDDNSKVKDSDVTSFIVDADALIDSYLSARYSLPVTGTRSLAVLKLYSRALVADKVAGILQIKQSTNQGANQNVRSGLSTKDVLKQLGDLRDGSGQLPDADLASPGGGISSFNVKTGRVPEFRKDEKQW